MKIRNLAFLAAGSFLLNACGDSSTNMSLDEWIQKSSSSSDEYAESSSSAKNPSSSSVAYSSSSSESKEILDCNGAKSLYDLRDKNEYALMQIGDQCWMAENLNYENKDESLKKMSTCIPTEGNDCSNGRLYTFAAAMNDPSCGNGSHCEGILGQDSKQGACPAGYHMPNHMEWQKLDSVVRLNPNLLHKFASKPTGEATYNSDEKLQIKMDKYARFWSSKEVNFQAAEEWYFNVNGSYLQYQDYDKSVAYAVRCVSDRFYQVPESSSSFEESSSSEEISSSSEASSSSSVSSSSAQYEFNCDDCDEFTDTRDGEVYHSKIIAGLRWMTEDLRYKGVTYGTVGCPERSNGNPGCLYNQEAALHACPAGWDLPTIDQMHDLIRSAYPEYQNSSGFSLDACPLLAQNNGITSCSEDIVNTTGFGAVATGERQVSWNNLDIVARYWLKEASWMWYLTSVEMQQQMYNVDYGYAVRCVIEDSQGRTSSSEAVSSSSETESSSSAPVSSSSEEVSSSSEFAE